MSNLGWLTTFGTLLTLIISVVTPIIKLNTTVVRLTTVVDTLVKNTESLTTDNTEAHKRLWNETESIKQNVHEVDKRLTVVEQRRNK